MATNARKIERSHEVEPLCYLIGCPILDTSLARSSSLDINYGRQARIGLPLAVGPDGMQIP